MPNVKPKRRWDRYTWHELRDMIFALEAELAEAKRDTERLDWLLENIYLELDCWASHPQYDEVRQSPQRLHGQGNSLREAIDAAIAQSKEPGEEPR